MDISKLNIYNKDQLIKDYLVGVTAKSVFNIIDNKEDLILGGGSALRKCYIPNYPRYTFDLDYSYSNISHGTFMNDLNDSLNEVILNATKSTLQSVRCSKLSTSKNGIVSGNIRFNKAFGKLDYTIGIDLAPISSNIPHIRAKLTPSKIDELLDTDTFDGQEIIVQELNHIVANKLYACLNRIGSQNQVGASMSRFKDIFDLWYLCNNGKLDFDLIKRYFWERAEKESIKSNNIVVNILNGMGENDSYMSNLLDFYLGFDNSDTKINLSYKYIKGLDKNYIIPNQAELYKTFDKICRIIHS